MFARDESKVSARPAWGRRLGPFCLLLLVVQATPLLGQRWYRPYQAGVQAVRQGLQEDAPADSAIWDQAIQQLEVAVNADPRPSRNKFVEGTIRERYFPYLYLGIACLRSGKLDEAQAHFRNSRDHGEAEKNRAAAAELASFESQLSDRMPEDVRAAGDEPVSDTRVFEEKVAEAQASLDAGRWEQAIAELDEAERINSQTFQAQNLGNRRDTARQSWAADKAGQAQRLMDSGSLKQARPLFEEAGSIWPGLDEAEQGLAAIRRREQQYRSAKGQAEQSFQSGDYAQTRRHYLDAQAAHPEMAADDNLAALLADLDDRISALGTLEDCKQAFDQGDYSQAQTLCARVSDPQGQLYRERAEARLTFQQAEQAVRRGDYSGAEDLLRQAVGLDGDYADASQALEKSRDYSRALADAQSRYQDWGGNLQQSAGLNSADEALTRAQGIDADRFGSDSQAQGLRRTINADLDRIRRRTVRSPVDDSVRQAVLRLFQGQIDEARQALEAIRKTNPRNAHAHFFLGVAYATSALQQAAGRDFQQLRSQALEHFRMTLKEDSDYPAPKRLISPLILGLFEEARE